MTVWFDDDDDDAAQEREAMECKAACMVNMALLMHRQGQYTEAFTWCERALKCAPGPQAQL